MAAMAHFAMAINNGVMGVSSNGKKLWLNEFVTKIRAILFVFSPRLTLFWATLKDHSIWSDLDEMLLVFTLI